MLPHGRCWKFKFLSQFQFTQTVYLRSNAPAVSSGAQLRHHVLYFRVDYEADGSGLQLKSFIFPTPVTQNNLIAKDTNLFVSSMEVNLLILLWFLKRICNVWLRGFMCYPKDLIIEGQAISWEYPLSVIWCWQHHVQGQLPAQLQDFIFITLSSDQ